MVIFGFCSMCMCIRKKPMTLSDSSPKAEGSGIFFRNLGRNSAKAGEKLTTKVLKNLGRALEVTSDLANVAATRNPKNVVSTLPGFINFYHNGRGQ